MRTKTKRQFEVPNISYTLISIAGSLERTFIVELMREQIYIFTIVLRLLFTIAPTITNTASYYQRGL